MAVAQVNIFGRKTIIEETREFGGIVSDIAKKTCQSAFFCNVHMLMLSQDDPVLASAMDNADWVFADSAPVAWLQRRISGKDAKVIPGYKVVLAVCDRAARQGEKVGFLGSTPDVLNQLVSNLSARFEGLSVAYQYSPPFMRDELISSRKELKALKDSGTHWLFVGLGCPKQEKWISTYGNQLDCHALAVGAAFDWLSGTVKKPPDWMERFGLAWVFRLLNNPRKMWSRYLIYNTKFLIRTGVFLIRGK
jgi:N-acetylglucosaminyldiphosphoundecaprenol N-acetyl-beta-D-mannosaminyltransferase